MKRPVVRLALAVIVLGISGCGDARQPAAPKLTVSRTERQLLFAFPRLGRLYADCGGAKVFRLRYTADRDVDEDLTVFVNSKRVLRRNLDPRRSLRFTVKIVHRPYKHTVVDESGAMKLVADVNRSPYGTRVNLRFRLKTAADGTRDCIAESAKMRITSDLHLG